MIRRTYKQFYGKFRDQFNPDEYMQCVERENMVGMFGSMLEYSVDSENLMTPYNMPCIDLGDVPETHSFMRAEADQVYYVPHNTNPDQVYVRYSYLFPRYHSRNFEERFKNSTLPIKEIPFREWMSTITLASRLQINYRARILHYDRICWGSLAATLFLFVILGAATSGENSGYGVMLTWLIIYFICVPIVLYVTKRMQNQLLRQAHFVLAVVCRAENNRYYLKRGVECRPGYLAQWIEFKVIDTEDGTKDVIEVLRKRQIKAIEDMQEMAELDHLKQMGGINRNLTKQAIDLKIKIREEEAGKKLNDDEKQELINEQLKRPQSQAAVRRLNQRMGLEGQVQQQRPPEEEESSSVSSDWDDW